MRTKIVIAVIAGLFCSAIFASEKQAQVMFFGTFHFTNPGLDVIKNKQADVTTKENQDYLVELTSRIADGFKPTHVLVECTIESQDELDAEYQAYLDGGAQLGVNEIHQLGFRVAKNTNLSGVHCYDERNVQWQAEKLFKELPEKSPALKKQSDELINKITKQFDEMYANSTLKEIFAEMNSHDIDNLNKGFYLLTNEVGAFGDGFSGADAAASWWHRNFRMYANVQSVAQPLKRVFVIGGQGHTAILKDLARYDFNRELIAIDPYL